MKKFNKFLITTLALLMVAGNAYSQDVTFSSVSENYVGTAAVPCTNCSEVVDGVNVTLKVNYRLTNRTIGADPNDSTQGTNNFNFDIQLKTADGVAPFDLLSTSVYLSYNPVAFGRNAFAGATRSCRVTPNPATAGKSAYSNTPSNIASVNSNLGSIATLANGIPIRFSPIGGDDFAVINDEWKTLYSISCTISPSAGTAPAGLQFEATQWDLTFRRNPETGEDDTVKYAVTAENSFAGSPIFEAPVVIGSRTELWQDNRGINLVFDRVIEDPSPSSFWANDTTVATNTATIQAIATTPTTITIPNPNGDGTMIDVTNLGIEFARSADTLRAGDARLIVGVRGVVSVADTTHTYTTPTVLAMIPPSSNDLRITRIHLESADNQEVGQVQLSIAGFTASSGTSLSGLATRTTNPDGSVSERFNFTVPGLSVIGVSTNSSGIVLAVRPVNKRTSSITVTPENRLTCIGTACIRPILPSNIATIRQRTNDFLDRFAPEATYTVTNRGGTAAGSAAGTINYTGITYRVTFDEDVTNPPIAELVQRSRVGSVGSVTGGATVACVSTMGSSEPLRDYTCTQSGNAVFNPSAGDDAAAEFLLRLTTAQDSAGNNAVPLTAPVGVATIRAIAVAVPDSNTDLWVVVDYGSTVTNINQSLIAQSTVTIASSDTITGVSHTTPMQGFPPGLPLSVHAQNGALNGVIDANVIHFRLMPTGTLDGGESALGVERFSFRITTGTLMAGGSPNTRDAIEFDAIANGAPEIISLMLSSPGMVSDAPGSLVVDGETTTTRVYTLSGIVYRMEVTEPLTQNQLDNISTYISLYGISQTPEASSSILAMGVSIGSPSSDQIRITSATTVSSIGGSSYNITFNATLTRVGDTGLGNPGLLGPDVLMFPRGLVAVIDPNAFSALGIEDCQGRPTWYATGLRTTTRDTACVSQNAVAAPDVYGPEATYTLTSRATVSQGSTGTLNYNGIAYRVTFTEDVMDPVAELVQRTRSGAVSPAATMMSTMTSAGGLRDYTFEQNSTAVFNPSASDPVVEYYIRLTTANDVAGNFVQNPFPQSADLRVATIRAIPLAITGSNDLFVIVDYGSAVMINPSAPANATLENAMITVRRNGGTIRSASISGIRVGVPEQADLPMGVSLPTGVTAANTISFRLTPSGTLDGGESAQGHEVFAFVLPAGTLRLGGPTGSPNTGDALEFNAIANGRPEITSLWLYSQEKSMRTSSTVVMVNGEPRTDTTFTLGTITYLMRATEAIEVSRTSVKLYSISQTPAQVGRSLMTGATFSPSNYVEVASSPTYNIYRTSSGFSFGSDSFVYVITFSNVELTREGSNGTLPNGLVAVIEPSAFSDSGIEDCQGTMWYLGSRSGTRTTPCVSQNAAETPSGDIPEIARLTQGNTRNDGVTFVARSALSLPLAERMSHFGWITTNTVSATAYTGFSSGVEIVDLATLPSATDRMIWWRLQESRGFYLSDRDGDYAQTINILKSVSFTRSVTPIPHGRMASVDLMADSDRGTTLTEVIIVGARSGATQRTVPISRGSGFVSIGADDADTYSIMTSDQVWGIGEPLSRLLTASATVGGMPLTRAVALAEDAVQPIRFVSYGQPAIPANENYIIVVEVSGLPDTIPSDTNCMAPGQCGNFVATATSVLTVNRVTIESSGTRMLVTIAPTMMPADSVARISVRLREVTTSDNPRSATLVTYATIIDGMTGLQGPDSDGDGIADRFDRTLPAGFSAPSDDRSAVNGLPVYYDGTFAGYIRATAGGRVQVSPLAFEEIVARFGSPSFVPEENFNANGFLRGSTSTAYLPGVRLPEGTQAVFGFQASSLDYEGSGISDQGQFVAATAGIVVPLPSVRRWEPQKLVGSEAVPFPRSQYGVFDSQGGSCPDDTGRFARGDYQSPYRDGSGNLRSNEEGNCMVLEIVDGSVPFDADGQENGIAIDFFSVGPSLGGGGGGGGGSNGFLGLAISLTQFVGITILLLLATAYGMYRRRKQPQPVRIIVKK